MQILYHPDRNALYKPNADAYKVCIHGESG